VYGAYSLIVTSLYVISLAPLSPDARFPAMWMKKLFFIFVGWSIFWILLNYSLDSVPYADAASITLVNFLIQLTANFAIGCYLSLTDTKWFRISILASWICMFVFVLVKLDPDTLSVHGGLYWGEARGLADPKSFATYQGFARSALLTSFILLAITKTFLMRLLIATISSITLFLLSARSELVGFVFALAVFEILVSLRKPSRVFVLALLGLIGAIFLTYFGESLLNDVSDSRITALGHLGEDHSWQLRLELSHRAFTQVMDNPLLGSFGGEYYDGTGEEGYYAHNILSAWVSLGLPGFLLYLSLLLGTFGVALKRAFGTKGNSDLWNLALLTSVTALLLSFSAKSIFESWFGLAFGLVLNVAGEE
jgi:O-antigen ligase